MREALYKAKRIDDGEWVYGSLLYQGHGRAYIIKHDCDFGVVAFCEECAVPYDASYGDRGSQLEVIPETICEYVNLMDCDFAKIFNGDFLKDKDGTIWLMTYATGWWSYQIVSQNTKVQQHCTICPITRTDVGDYLPSMKIIGNKFNNPELLKE